jgi:hypothetical protein
MGNQLNGDIHQGKKNPRQQHVLNTLLSQFFLR